MARSISPIAGMRFAIVWLALFAQGIIRTDSAEILESADTKVADCTSAIQRFSEFELEVSKGTMTRERYDQHVCDYNWSVGNPADAPIADTNIDEIISELDNRFGEGQRASQIIRDRVRAYCRVMGYRHIRAYTPYEIEVAFSSFEAAIKDGRMNVVELKAKLVDFNWSVGRPKHADLSDISIGEIRTNLANQADEGSFSSELIQRRHDIFCRSIGLAIPK